jgi:hypothetical protein
VTPEQLYIALADVIVDCCGGHSAVRKEAITPAEWQELNSRWEMILLMNREKNDERNSVRQA